MRHIHQARFVPGLFAAQDLHEFGLAFMALTAGGHMEGRMPHSRDRPRLRVRRPIKSCNCGVIQRLSVTVGGLDRL